MRSACTFPRALGEAVMARFLMIAIVVCGVLFFVGMYWAEQDPALAEQVRSFVDGLRR